MRLGNQLQLQPQLGARIHAYGQNRSSPDRMTYHLIVVMTRAINSAHQGCWWPASCCPVTCWACEEAPAALAGTSCLACPQPGEALSHTLVRHPVEVTLWAVQVGTPGPFWPFRLIRLMVRFMPSVPPAPQSTLRIYPPARSWQETTTSNFAAIASRVFWFLRWC